MDKIKTLLNQVSIIQKKYDDLAQYSGEHYNVFDILGVTSDELSHSAILTNLLDTKGKHGQKELFLELFLNEIKKKFEESDKKKKLEIFDTKNSHAIKEKHAGRVDYESDKGGRIDIVINDGKNNIIIENKIYAGDQPKQLVRYNEYDKNAPILYLTLDGKEPSVDSKGNLVLNKDFVCISYSIFIKDWLENCIKEMANKPIIRETLNQYLFLIKALTNQNSNNQMEKDLQEIILNNYESAKEISNNFNRVVLNLSNDVFLKVFKELELFLENENWMVFRKDEVLDEKKGGAFYARPINCIKENWAIGLEGFNPFKTGHSLFGNKISIGVIGFEGVKEYYDCYLPLQNRNQNGGWWNDYVFLDNYRNLETSFKNGKLIAYLAIKNNQEDFVEYVVNDFKKYFEAHKNHFERMTNELQRNDV